MRIFYKIFLFFSLTCYTFASTPVSVEAYDEQKNNPNHLTLKIRINNNTLDTLKNVVIRYFLPYEETRKLEVSPYYLDNAKISIDTLNNNLSVNIRIMELPPGTFPNSSGLSLGMNYADYGDFNKIENFSYPGSDNFKVVDNMPVYLDDLVLVGQTIVLDDIPKVHIVFFQPNVDSSLEPSLKLVNNGKSINLKYLFLLDKFHYKHSLQRKNNISSYLVAGDTLNVCINKECKGDTYLPKTILENYGELMLKYNATILDYVSWGIKGTLSSVAVNNGVWKDSTDYIVIDNKIKGPSLTYNKGDFFSRSDVDGITSFDWMKYSFNERKSFNGSLPNTEPFSWNDEVKIILPSDKKVCFSWKPILGALSYRLNIFSQDSVIIYQEETSKTSTDIFLLEGKYIWGVESNAKNIDSAKWENESINSAKYQVELLAESQKYVESFSLDVVSRAARKDTKLLVPNWGMYAKIRDWDNAHIGNHHWDEEESYRCWAVGINILNHYFGGDLTQDEIKIYGMKKKWNFKKDSILWAFPLEALGAASDSVIMETLSWALGGVNVEYFEGILADSIIKNSINNKKPLYVGNQSHIMVIDAYRIREDKVMEVRFLNPHNNGGSEWQEYSTAGIIGYFLYDKPKQVLKRDSLITVDSDNDGITDFDEKYRFKTNPYSMDSDGDGVFDKVEILSYTIREIVNQKPALSDSLYNPINMQNNVWILGIEKEILADSDKDNFRAEIDLDSDNDGIKDGEEDINKNGIIDEGETDPYIADFNIKPIHSDNDIPGDFALYSLDYISINDGSKCYDYKNYPSNTGAICSFATESKRKHYAVYLAGGNKQKILHSMGDVLLRNKDTINYVYLYTGNDYKPRLDMQKDAIALGSSYVSELNWPWSVSTELQNYYEGNEEKIVRAGESFTLKDGDVFKILKVESNAILQIDKGEMFLGDLQIESGAKINYINQGQPIIMHSKGSVLWKGKIETQGLNALGIRNRLVTIASQFKFIYHGENPLIIEGEWAGTIFAPNAKLILGQAEKKFYGRFLGNGITVHQYASLYSVPFQEVLTPIFVLNKRQ